MNGSAILLITGVRLSHFIVYIDGDPSDAIRAVNAVLTSLDTLRRRKNILVLCTSNMMDGIDAV